MKTFSILKNILILCFLIVLYNGLLYLVSLFPSDLIYENSYKSAEILVDEGQLFQLLPNETIDTGADVLIIDQAYCIDNTEPVESYLTMRRNYKKGFTEYVMHDTPGNPVSYLHNYRNEDGYPEPDHEGFLDIQEFYAFLNGEVTVSIEYARYYFGSIIFYRPLLLIMDLFGIRILQFIILMILFIAFAYLLYKKLGKNIMFAFCVPLTIVGYFIIFYSLQQAPLMMVTMIGSIILLLRIEKYTWDKLSLLCLIVGSVGCYLDFLTFPALSLCIPLLIYTLYYCKNENINNIKLFLKVLVPCIWWAIGYVATWASKWIICDLLTDTGIFQNSISQILYRTNGMVEYYYQHLNSLVIRTVFFFASTYIIIFILDLINKKRNISKCDKPSKNSLILLFICLLPVLWFFTFYSHSIFHTFMTCRNFMLMMTFAFLMYFNEVSLKKE